MMALEKFMHEGRSTDCIFSLPWNRLSVLRQLRHETGLVEDVRLVKKELHVGIVFTCWFSGWQQQQQHQSQRQEQ